MTETQTITVKGERYIVVPEREYRRLQAAAQEDPPPLLPEADEQGNRPAVEYATVSLARKIIDRRRRLELTQAELAKAAGVRPETISRLESAKHVPSIATVDKIDRALREAEGNAEADTKTTRRSRAGKRSKR